MSKYRKKPVAIEAVQWTGENLLEICNFTGRCGGELIKNGELYIDTLEGVHHASVGDFIIKGVHGEFYPCKPDIFRKTYTEEKPQTNADRVRAMSDEELADALMRLVKGLVETEGRVAVFEEGVREELICHLRQPAKGGEGE